MGAWLDIPPGVLAGPAAFDLHLQPGLPGYEGYPPLTGYSIGAVDADSGAPLIGFASPLNFGADIGSVDLAGAAVADLRIASLDSGSWTVLPTTVSGTELVAAISAPGVYGVVEITSAGPNDGVVTLTTDAPEGGMHRIDPGALLTIDLRGSALTRLRNVLLTEQIPAGWQVVDAGDATADGAGDLDWSSLALPAGASDVHRIVLRAPMVGPDGSPAFTATFHASISHRGGSTASPDVTVLVAPRVIVAHPTFALVGGTSLQPTYLPADTTLSEQPRFEVFRIRFQVRNADSLPVGWTPELDYRTLPDGTFAPVPSMNPVAGVPFYVRPEWEPLPGGTGTRMGNAQAPIPITDLRSLDTDGPDEQPVDGMRWTGAVPVETNLGARSYTEIEFSLSATVDAVYLGSYEFRLSDAGQALVAGSTARLDMGPKPALMLSPGQRAGLVVPGPHSGAVSPPSDASGALYPLVIRQAPVAPVASAVPSPGVGSRAGASGAPSGAVAYPLLPSAAISPGTVAPSLVESTFVSPHVAYGLTSDTCAACHSAHEAQSANLLANGSPEAIADQSSQATLCLSCHDGSGAETNVGAQYNDPSVPLNDASTASIYRHDALAVSTHTNAGEDEFQDANGQPILNRHSECSDCHQPHRATSGDSVETASGWTLTGSEVGSSGVSVVNGAAGSAPTYAFLDGSAAAPSTYEYQLCFKCHSGFTQLLAHQPGAPSEWSIDKGVELNPANLSYHPVEAPGKNTTSAMDLSLAGTSPYKLWDFTTGSTVRCVNCHADQSAVAWPDPPSPPPSPPAAGADLPTHASQNRGLLLQQYQDRQLKPPTEEYTFEEFALCYLCHAEAPFVDTSGDQRVDTNFALHGTHLDLLSGMGSGGTSIDTAGDGGGNAICAECHFRTHSTASENDFRSGILQTGTDGGLVVFAPDVQPNDGVLSWTRTGENSGTCTLTCHGYPHLDATYGPASAPSP